MSTEPAEQTDDQLCQRLQDEASDRGAFDELVRRHLPGVARFVSRYLDDRQIAEDVVQETFLRAYMQIQRFEVGTNFRAWLLAIARFLCMAEWRKAKRRPHALAIEAAAEPAIELPEQPDPEFLERLRDAYRQLSAPQQEIITMRIYDGLSYRDIAQVTGDKEVILRSRMHDALEKLKKIL